MKSAMSRKMTAVLTIVAVMSAQATTGIAAGAPLDAQLVAITSAAVEHLLAVRLAENHATTRNPAWGDQDSVPLYTSAVRRYIQDDLQRQSAGAGVAMNPKLTLNGTDQVAWSFAYLTASPGNAPLYVCFGDADDKRHLDMVIAPSGERHFSPAETKSVRTCREGLNAYYRTQNQAPVDAPAPSPKP